MESIENGVEYFETDAWLTKDKNVILTYDNFLKAFLCDKINDMNKIIFVYDYNYEEIESCRTSEGYKILLLEDIMKITKGKIFMNLEIKDDNEEIWDKIQE